MIVERILPTMGEHFVQTSYSRYWHGKYRCAYCTVSGWPERPNWRNPQHWSLKHGAFCKKRPESPFMIEEES